MCGEANLGTWHRIIIGDSRDMGEIADSSIHLTMTSPPYVTSRFKKEQSFNVEECLECFLS